MMPKMKHAFLLSVVFTVYVAASAQTRGASVQQVLDSVSDDIKADSIWNRLQSIPKGNVDASRKIDSIRNNFTSTFDSINTQYQNAFAKIDAPTKKLNSTIDSLGTLNLPTAKYETILDSLKLKRQRLEEKFASSLNSLKEKTIGKLGALDLPPEYKGPMEELTKNISDLNVKTGNIGLSELRISGNHIPKIDGISDLISKPGGNGNLDNFGSIPGIKLPVGDIGKITQQGNGYQEDIKNIAQGNLDGVQKLPDAIEDKASKIDGIDELQKQSVVLDEQKARLDDFKDPEKAKEKAVEMAREAAVDHFAGKQEQLKAAMDKMSKYKKKYPSVSSVEDLLKRPPNPMKGLPFIERLVPGLYLQYQQKKFYLIDVNPYLGYKLNGRFTSGIGWNHRYGFDKGSHSFTSRSKIFGPRSYVDFKLDKGFIAHVEGESMNTFVPSTLQGNPDTGHREWVWSLMTGMKKEYKIYKNLKGTALIQYNLFNRYYKAPYVDRLNSRVGFEYILKKKKR